MRKRRGRWTRLAGQVTVRAFLGDEWASSHGPWLRLSRYSAKTRRGDGRLISERLGLGRLVDETVDLGARAGAARPGRKVLSLCHAMVGGADSIDDAEVLHAGGTEAILGHRTMAPSTLGTFLRAFTFGHVRQLDRVFERSIERAWATGAGSGSERLVVDLDVSSARCTATRSRAPASPTAVSAVTTR